MNGENSVISFSCNFCGQKIRVAKTSAGKKGKCPKCGKTVFVPDVAAVPSPDMDSELIRMKQDSGGATQGNSAGAGVDQLQLLRESMGWGSVKQETPPRRKLPWLIDIFLYPVNTWGLMLLAIAIVIPFLLDLVIFSLGPFLGGLIIIPGFIMRFVIAMYAYWYIVRCITDSSAGGIRAPNTIAETPGLAEMLLELIRILACLALCVAPAFFYRRWSGRTDNIYWILIGFGAFYYPMALLAVGMFDSFAGLSPLIVIPSIFGTFFQYCALTILFAGIGLLFRKAKLGLLEGVLLYHLWRLLMLYLLMVAAHLLGRFFFKYQEKLNWDV